MTAEKERIFDRTDALNEISMVYEVHVVPLFKADYLKEFYDFFRVRTRKAKLLLSEGGFDDALKELAGEYRWEETAGKTKELFGPPARVTAFAEDESFYKLREELGGRRGCSGFFFVFDVMFCEYEGFTLCYICGTNN